MFRLASSALCLLIGLQSVALSQAPTGSTLNLGSMALGTGTTTAPSRDIRNLASTQSGQINCWVGRTTDTAIAISIPAATSSTSPMDGRMRLYTYNPTLQLYTVRSTLPFKDSNNNTTMISDPMVRLNPLATQRSTRYTDYEMVYRHTDMKDYVLGWVRFIPGKTSTSSPMASVRLNRKNLDPPPAPMGNGCNEPPADDVGEEELIAEDATKPTFPAPTVPRAASSGTFTP